MLRIAAVSLFLALGLPAKWTKIRLGDNLTIQFPTNPTVDKTFTDITSYLCSNANCDFSVDIEKYPEPVFPKNDKQAADFLEMRVERTKKDGVFISNKRVTIGKITGMEIKRFFVPKPTIRMVEVTWTFFLKYKIYTVRCLYKGNNQIACDNDCKMFLSSLKLDK